MSGNNKAVEGNWSAGSEGRVIAEKSGVVVAQCLWQEDAELIVAMRNNMRVAQLESAVARIEAAMRETGMHLPPGTPTAAQIAEAIAQLATSERRLKRQVQESVDDADNARKGWREEISLREEEVKAHEETKLKLSRVEAQLKQIESKLADGQRREAFEERDRHAEKQAKQQGKSK